MRFAAFLLAVLLAGHAAGEDALAARLQTLRAETGLSMPAWDEELAASCRDRAAELAAAGELSHVDGRGRGPGVQALALGLPPGEYGEALGSGPSSGDVWAAWLGSPAHRAVLAAAGWTKWGWGSAPAGAVTVYVVRFWRP